jgi:DNA recombination protein RmuC
MDLQQLGVVLVAAVVGLAAGAAAVGARRSRTIGADLGLAARLDVQASELRRLADASATRDLAADQLRAQLEGARRALELLESRERARQAADVEARETVRRLATVLAGDGARGKAGENVLRERLAELPPGMLVTDFRVGGKVVEFGLVLPDGRRLPIDSKWTAAAELEALDGAGPAEREAAARSVERAVVARAREVARYLDPALTAPVAVAAVPDAAYGVLKRAHADAYANGVIVVPYGSALPIVLFLYALVQRHGGVADVRSGLTEISGMLDAIASVVENKVARAATMLTNGADELRSHVGRARGSIARARPRAAPADQVQPLREDRGADADRLTVLPGGPPCEAPARLR